MFLSGVREIFVSAWAGAVPFSQVVALAKEYKSPGHLTSALKSMSASRQRRHLSKIGFLHRGFRALEVASCLVHVSPVCRSHQFYRSLKGCRLKATLLGFIPFARAIDFSKRTPMLTSSSLRGRGVSLRGAECQWPSPPPALRTSCREPRGRCGVRILWVC